MSLPPAPTAVRDSGVRTTARARLAGVAAMAIVIDAMVKLAAVRWLTEPLDLGWMTVRVTHNAGVAFGLGAGLPVVVIAVLTGLVVAVLGVVAWRGDLGHPVPAGLIVGGGLANLADRTLGGSVVDLFDLGWWPVFNLADMFLTVGMVGLLLAGHGPAVGRRAVADRTWRRP